MLNLEFRSMTLAPILAMKTKRSTTSTMETRIDIIRWDEMKEDLKQDLQNAPINEWGNIPFIRNTVWSTPNWSIILTSSNGSRLCFVNLVERAAKFNNKSVNVVGINNLIVSRDYRGKGFGKKVMNKAQSFMMNELVCECGLLLCADEVAKFYEKMDWAKFSGRLLFNQRNKKVEWHQNTYLYPKMKMVEPTEIDLCGEPW